MKHFKVILIVVSCLTISCRKKIDAETQSTTGILGHWSHYTGPDEYHHLSIDLGGGSIWTYSNGTKTIISEKKQWFLKNNNLFYGRFSSKNEKFEIDTFPQMASSTFTIEYDVVDSGQRYMWLDGNLYHW